MPEIKTFYNHVAMADRSSNLWRSWLKEQSKSHIYVRISFDAVSTLPVLYVMLYRFPVLPSFGVNRKPWKRPTIWVGWY